MASLNMKFHIQKSGSEYYVTFVAKNGETLGHTENYTSKASATHCANLLKEQAGSADIIDNT
jgi:uncharacterized protein YegP (UPF0339 family)